MASCSFQPVEKPGCASSGSRVSGVYRGKKLGKPVKEVLLPLPTGQLFQIHGSKLMKNEIEAKQEPALYRR